MSHFPHFRFISSASSSRRYSPLPTSKRRRGTDRSFDRNDYHSSSSRRGGSENHRSSREHISETYDLTTSSSSRLISSSSSSRKRRAPHSPSPIRSHSKRHSRSNSPPRAFRSAASPAYYGRSSRADSSSRARRSITPPSRKIDISDKITDTSLFAELVKDKRKRTKVLQEILDKKEEPTIVSSGENSNSALNNNDLVIIDSVDSASMNSQTSNGVSKEAASRFSLGDIPMPNASNDTIQLQPNVNANANVADQQAQPIEPGAVALSNSKTVSAVIGASTLSIAVISNNLNADIAAKQIRTSPAAIVKKPKSLTKLPMPPGVNVAELEDITTPSPPQSSGSPIGGRQTKLSLMSIAGTKLSASSASASKKGLLNLPMPPMVPGSEDLSGDDDYISSPNSHGRTKHNSNARKGVKRKRPTILNRRNSRSLPIKDWGERCVDVFEVIAQIGEGTYGQVGFARARFGYCFNSPVCRCTKPVIIMQKRWSP